MKRLDNWPKQPQRYDDLPPLFQEEYDRYIYYMLGHQRVKLITLENRIAGHVLRYLEFLASTLDLKSSADAGAVEMVDFLSRESACAHSTAKKMRQSLKSYLKWQCLQKMLDPDEILIYDSVRPRTSSHAVKKQPKALTLDEGKKIFRNIAVKYPYDPRPVDLLNREKYLATVMTRKLKNSLINVQLQCAVMLCLEVGLRVRELWGLTIDDVDPVNRTIYVRPEIAKNSKARTVAYPEAVKQYVIRWLAHRHLIVGEDSHTALWIAIRPSKETKMGQPVKFETFRRWIEQIYDGDVNAGWHILRKTFATIRWRSGMDLGVISKMLGHDDIRTTEIYIGITEQHIIEEDDGHGEAVSSYFAMLLRKGEEMANNDKEKAS